MAGKETKVQNDIMCMLSWHPKIAWAMVTTTGEFRVRGGYITIGAYYINGEKHKDGLSDIIGMLKGGRLFVIEVKKPGETPTPPQWEFINFVNDMGGLAGFADSVEMARELIDECST